MPSPDPLAGLPSGRPSLSAGTRELRALEFARDQALLATHRAGALAVCDRRPNRPPPATTCLG